MGKIARLAREGWLVLGRTLLLFCLIEAVFIFVAFVEDRLESEPGSDMDVRATADAYPDPSWVRAYYHEFRRSHHAEWKPYVYWRLKPFSGEHINVDAEGIRRTVQPAAAAGAPRPLRIFMFGGSALWGTGARDAYTIPSLLAAELHRAGVASEVTNFGESAYVSTQEVVALLTRLQRGERPDWVIFYDGVNDTYSAYQQRVAGIPQNEFNRAREFNLTKSNKFKVRRAMALRDLVDRLETVRHLRRWFLGGEDANRRGPREAPPPDGGALARGVVEAYSGNVALVKALGDELGFRCLFYWQPTIFHKKSLTEYERARRDELRVVEPFLRETYAAVGRSALAREPRFHDLSTIFTDAREPLYVDWCHLAERGNEIVAARMARDLLKDGARAERAARSGRSGRVAPARRARR